MKKKKEISQKCFDYFIKEVERAYVDGRLELVISEGYISAKKEVSMVKFVFTQPKV